MTQNTDEIRLDLDVSLDVRSDEARTVEGMLVPYDVPIRHSRGVEQFARGAFADVVPEEVPLLWHHDPRDPIGRLESVVERDDGLYGTFRIADTSRGRDYLALARERVTRGLSVGFNPDESESTRDGVRTHTRVDLREVSAVTWPAYAGSKVLEVRERQQAMADENVETTETPETPETIVDDQNPPTEVRTADLDEIRDEIRQLRAELGEGPPRETRDDDSKVAIALVESKIGRVLGMAVPEETRAIADVVADLGSSDASGLTPDYYWAAGLKANVDRRRPFVAAAGSAQFPAYGNNLVTGKVTQEPEGESGLAQKTAITSTALEVDPVTFPIVWHKIALDIAIELAEQGNPDALGVAARAMLRWYAKASDTDAVTKAEAAATNTGTAWSSFTTLAEIAAALVAGGTSIEDETGEFGDIVALSPTNFGTFIGLTGASGPWDSDTPRDLTLRSINWAGFRIFRDTNVTEALQYNVESVRVGERNPISVAATNVEKFGYDRGYIGATVVDLWAEGLVEHAA